MHKKENLKKYFLGSRELLQAHKKVCDENESRNKVKIVGRKEFIRRVRKTRVMDIKRLQVNNS